MWEDAMASEILAVLSWLKEAVATLESQSHHRRIDLTREAALEEVLLRDDRFSTSWHLVCGRDQPRLVAALAAEAEAEALYCDRHQWCGLTFEKEAQVGPLSRRVSQSQSSQARHRSV
jgi:hypothetical protein